VKGNTVEFSFTSQAGTVKYTGTLEGEKKIAGKCEYGELGNGTFTGVKD
jgi:hypothetical protein